MPLAQKASTVEDAIREDIAKSFGGRFDKRRFLPYVQMHEFEAILFSRPVVISEVVGLPDIADDLQAVRNKFATPEEINDGPTTAPSKRIGKLSPAFRKVLHGVIAAQRIGIEAIRQECPHFNQCLSALEQLGMANLDSPVRGAEEQH